MNSDIMIFFNNYSLSSIVISLTVAILTELFDNFLAKKLPTTIRIFFPFILGILFSCGYCLIFEHQNIATDGISCGIICGSLSIVFTAFYKKIKNGSKSTDILSLTIEEILRDFISESVESLSCDIANLIRKEIKGEYNENELETKITQKILNAFPTADQTNVKSAVSAIMLSKKTLLNL